MSAWTFEGQSPCEVSLNTQWINQTFFLPLVCFGSAHKSWKRISARAKWCFQAWWRTYQVLCICRIHTSCSFVRYLPVSITHQTIDEAKEAKAFLSDWCNWNIKHLRIVHSIEHQFQTIYHKINSDVRSRRVDFWFQEENVQTKTSQNFQAFEDSTQESKIIWCKTMILFEHQTWMERSDARKGTKLSRRRFFYDFTF